jgi:hypothetical protein
MTTSHRCTQFELNISKRLNECLSKNINSYKQEFKKYSKEVIKVTQFTTNKQENEHSRSSTGITCRNPKYNIAFLKTHKTASSTITNIVQRFGYYRNLTFVMPLKDINQQRYNYIGKQGESITQDNIIPKLDGEQYNILCNHVVYDMRAFQNILPNNTFLFTMIREPFSQFISTLNYYGHASTGYISSFLNQNVSNPLSTYLQSPWRFEPVNPHYSMTNNKMSIDLGMPTGHIRNGSLIKFHLQKLKASFHLVLLQEYFDESLILLKRHTCWSFKDVIYISHNIWPFRREFNLSADDINKHRLWNTADYMLYETFFKVFWDKVLKQKYFFSEVLYFKRIQKKVALHCSDDRRSTTLTIMQSKWSKGFTLTSEDCYFIRMNEATFTKHIHKKMMFRINPFGNFSWTQTTKKQRINKLDKHLFMDDDNKMNE